MSLRRELALTLALFVLCAALSLALQAPLTYHEGKGWDGVAYFQLAQQISQGERPATLGPFAFRLGTPALVGWLFPHQLLLGFKLVNLAGCLLATLLLPLWLRRFVHAPWLRLALIVAFLTPWHAPLRFTAHYAAYTDPWLFVFLLAILLTRGAPQLALCLVGALFRESVATVALALTLASRGRAWPTLLASGLGIGLTHLFATQTDSYSFARTVGQWAYNKPLPVYVHGLFIAFGPALVLPLFFWRTAWAWLREHEALAWLLAGFLVLGWVGGSDTERIVYWALPVVYPLIGVILEKHALPRGFLVALVALQLLAHRIFWLLPDFPTEGRSPLPLFTPLSSHCQYPDLWSYQAERRIQAVALAQYLFVTTLLWLWLRSRPHRQKTSEEEVP